MDDAMVFRAMTEELTPLQMIVLAFVIQRPSYGYEIACRVRSGVCGSFLRPKRYRSAVYGALKRLDELGLVVVDRDAGERQITTRRFDRRRFYGATPEGAWAYERRITSELEREAERAEILARIASAARLGTPALRKILAECEKLCDEREHTLAAVQTLDALDPSIGALCERLVLAERRIALDGQREWITLSQAAIDAYEQERRLENETGREAMRRLARNGSAATHEIASVESQVTVDV